MAKDWTTATDLPDSDAGGNVTISEEMKAAGDGMAFATSGQMTWGQQTYEAKVTNKFGYDGSVSTGMEHSVTQGNTTAKVEQELKLGKELEMKEKVSLSEKIGITEQEVAVEQGLSADGEKLSYGVGAEASQKVGTEDAYTKTTTGAGAKLGSDGSVEMEASQGVEAKAGGVETSMKHTSTTGFGTEEMSNGETGESVSHTEKVEMGAKAEVADGVTVSHSESVEIGTKSAESANASSEETTVAFESETRIEVDAEKAGVGAAVAAGAFNATMATKEAIMKELFKLTSKSESETEEVEQEESQEQPQEPEEEEESQEEKTEEKTEENTEEANREQPPEETREQERPEEEAAAQETEKEPEKEKEQTEDNGQDYYNGLGY